MIFTDIHLQNFRSYKDSSFELGPEATIVVGPNAAGKTNLLEAVMLAAVNKTYRPAANLVKHNCEWSRVEVHTNKNNKRVVKLTEQEQIFEVDGKAYKNLPFSQKQPVVIFEPYDLFLLHGDPQKRREYLDNLLGQLDPAYQKTRREYKRILAQRNSLLKQNNRDNHVVFALNIKLSETAAVIFHKRKQLIEKLNEELENTYEHIANTTAKTNLIYKSETPATNYSANLLKQLEQNIDKDLLRGFTSAGPHRDDLECILNGELASATGSRGEARTFILSLKILELKLIEEKLGTKPLLLLDDVFSELDGARRKALISFLIDHQTIITTTDADIVSKNFSQNCQIIPLG